MYRPRLADGLLTNNLDSPGKTSDNRAHRTRGAVRFQLLSLFVVTALVAPACGGGSSPTSPGGTSGGTGSTLSALIDGAVWNQPNVTATYHQTNNPYLEIDSFDSSSNLFSFAFAKFNENGADLTTGTYAVGPTNTNANYVLVGGTSIWSAIPGVTGVPAQGSGSVVLTAFSKTSKTASGTFSFVLVNASSSKTVTNGMFNVTFK